MGLIQKSKKFIKVKVVPAAKSFGRELVSLLPWIAAGATIGAAWSGCVTASNNERRIRELEMDQDRLADVVNNNANVLKDHLSEMKELEEKNQKLLEESMDVTEGKEPVEPDEEADEESA